MLEKMPTVDVSTEPSGVTPVINEALVPTVKLLGHVLASSIGFAGLSVISLIPLVVIKFIVAIGFHELASALEPFERGILWGDILLLVVNLGIGSVLFVVETVINSYRSIKSKLEE